PGLRRRYPYNPAFMHPGDLERLGVRPGDVVRIDSAHDFMYGVVESTTDVLPGVVSMGHARGGEPQRDAEVGARGSATLPLGSGGGGARGADLRHSAPGRHPGDGARVGSRRARRTRVRRSGTTVTATPDVDVRRLPAGVPSPPATIDAMAWIAGRWVGMGLGG